MKGDSHNGFAGRHGDGRTEMPDLAVYTTGTGYLVSHALRSRWDLFGYPVSHEW